MKRKEGKGRGRMSKSKPKYPGLGRKATEKMPIFIEKCEFFGYW
jgi:hypothetical protein